MLQFNTNASKTILICYIIVLSFIFALGGCSQIPMGDASSQKKSKTPSLEETSSPFAAKSGADSSGEPSLSKETEGEGKDREIAIEAVKRSSNNDEQEIHSGLLTAATWNDVTNYTTYLSFLDDYPSLEKNWAVNTRNIVMIQVVPAIDSEATDPLKADEKHPEKINIRKKGIPGVKLEIRVQDLEIKGQTYAQGLFPIFLLPSATQDNVELEVFVTPPDGSRSKFALSIKKGQKIKQIALPNAITEKEQQQSLQISFLIDATGSMDDEMKYLGQEFADIVKRIKTLHENMQIELGLTFYRDQKDEFVTKHYPFITDVDQYVDQLKNTTAGGGGDYPEDLAQGLFQALEEQNWYPQPSAKLLFIVTDAPAQQYQQAQYSISRAIDSARAQGIKIIPIAASGVDRSAELLLRQMEVSTLGQYVFLTDDSGIGGSHLNPDLPKPEVKKLNDLLVNLIHQEVIHYYATEPTTDQEDHNSMVQAQESNGN